MLKKKAVVALALVGAMAMSACSSGTSKEENGDNDVSEVSVTSAASESGEDSESAEKVDITIMCAYASEDPHGQYVYEYADKFMEEKAQSQILWDLGLRT